VRSLIDNNINIAAVKRTAPPVIEGWETAQTRKEIKEEDRTGSAPVRVAAVSAPASDAPLPGSTDPIKPTAVKTVTVHPGAMQTAALSPLPSDSRQLIPTVSTSPANIMTVTTVKSEEPSPIPTPVSQPATNKPDILGTLPTKIASAYTAVPANTTVEVTVKPHSGWMIQVGALPDEKEARLRLEAAQNRAKDLLGKADPFTERIEKGDKVLFRARFAGLEKIQAEAACKHLKRSDIPCMMLKN